MIKFAKHAATTFDRTLILFTSVTFLVEARRNTTTQSTIERVKYIPKRENKGKEMCVFQRWSMERADERDAITPCITMTMLLLSLTLDVDSNGTNRSMRFINNAICDRYSRVAKLLIQFNASLASQATFAKKCFAYSGGLHSLRFDVHVHCSKRSSSWLYPWN